MYCGVIVSVKHIYSTKRENIDQQGYALYKDLWGYSYTCHMYCVGYSYTCRMYYVGYSYTCSMYCGDIVIHVVCIVGIQL